jgi:steroid delta-isomerase-like uncharacterized protein
MSENIDTAMDVVPGDITMFAEGRTSAEAAKAVVQRFVDLLLNRNDIGALDTIMAPNAVLEHAVLDKPVQGLDGIRKIIEAFHTGFPDLTCRIDSIIGEGDQVAFYLKCEGTHKGPFAGIAPTNKQVYWTALNMVTVKDGKIIRQRACDNIQNVLRAASTAT